MVKSIDADADKRIRKSEGASAKARAMTDAARVDAGTEKGGDTNITVVAPTTANSTSTSTQITFNPLSPRNQRAPAGVYYG